MPHDRLYEEDGKLKYQAEVKIHIDQSGNETLENIKAPVTDELCQLFINLYN